MSRLLVMYSNDPPSAAHRARLAALWPGGDVAVVADEDAARHATGEAEASVGHRYLRQVLPHAPRLRWVQSTAAGTDHLPEAALGARGILLTRCPIFAHTVATHALAGALVHLRGLAPAGPPPGTLPPVPRTAVVIGLGAVGQEIARVVRPLVERLVGVVRTHRPSPTPCDELLDATNWRDVLPQADVVFLAITARPENQHFLGAAELDALPPHAVVVNVGRGMTLDQQALAERLRSGCLAGAMLDVVDPFPAPDDPFWSTPHLLVTPKRAVFSGDRQQRLEEFVESQVARYAAGQLPLHPVPLGTGEGDRHGLR